jgi:hypothetical protein
MFTRELDRFSRLVNTLERREFVGVEGDVSFFPLPPLSFTVGKDPVLLPICSSNEVGLARRASFPLPLLEVAFSLPELANKAEAADESCVSSDAAWRLI